MYDIESLSVLSGLNLACDVALDVVLESNNRSGQYFVDGSIQHCCSLDGILLKYSLEFHAFFSLDLAFLLLLPFSTALCMIIASVRLLPAFRLIVIGDLLCCTQFGTHFLFHLRQLLTYNFLCLSILSARVLFGLSVLVSSVLKYLTHSAARDLVRLVESKLTCLVHLTLCHIRSVIDEFGCALELDVHECFG